MQIYLVPKGCSWSSWSQWESEADDVPPSIKQCSLRKRRSILSWKVLILVRPAQMLQGLIGEGTFACKPKRMSCMKGSGKEVLVINSSARWLQTSKAHHFQTVPHPGNINNVHRITWSRSLLVIRSYPKWWNPTHHLGGYPVWSWGVVLSIIPKIKQNLVC